MRAFRISIFLLGFVFFLPGMQFAQVQQGTYTLPQDQVIPGRPWTQFIPDPDKFDWSAGKEGRPGYRYRGMLPMQQKFYDYVQEKRRANQPLSSAELATIRFLISSRRWPETPRPNPFWAAFMRYLREQRTMDLNLAQSLMLRQLDERGLIPVDPPPNPNMERIREYLNSGPFRPRNWFERAFGRVEPWMDNYYAGSGYDMRPPAPSGNSFPAGDPFNGLKITYNVSGATVQETKDSEGFTIRRGLKGVLGTGSLTVSGTVRVGGYGADVSISVWAGDKKEEKKFYLKNEGSNGNPQNFSVSVPIPEGARTGGFAVNLDGRYSMGGGHRGCYLSGSFGPSQEQIEADRAAADAKWRAEVENTLKRLGYQNTPEGIEVEEMRKALAGGDAAWKEFVDSRLEKMNGEVSPVDAQYKELERAMATGGHSWDDYVAKYGIGGTAISSSNPEANAFIEQGKQLQADGKFKEAVEAFDKAIQADPKAADAYIGRGNANRSLRDPSAALKDFDRAIAVDPKNSEAYRFRSIVHRGNSDLPAALADANKAVELAPESYQAYLTRGLAKAELKDHAGAAADFDHAIRIEPNYANSYSYRGLARINTKDYSGALSDYDRYIRAVPTSSAAFNNRGLAKERLDDIRGAIADYKKALELNPENDVAKKNLARVSSQKPVDSPAGSAFYPADLSVIGGKKGNPHEIRSIPVDDGSYVRLKSTDNERLTFTVPFSAGFETSAVTIVTNLDDATYVAQGATTARMTVIKSSGSETFDIKAGIHTAEWNYGVGPKHQRPGSAAIGTDRYMVTFDLRQPGNVTAVKFDYVDTRAEKWYGHAPGFVLRGLTLRGTGKGNDAGTGAGNNEPAMPGVESVIFEVGNIYGVGNGPSSTTTFSLTRPYMITLVQTYHWNSGKGTTRPGTIGFRDERGKVYGPWTAEGLPGQGGVRNAYWQLNPNAVLPAGTYTILDSDPATWSQNSQSGGRGFVLIKGYPSR